MAVDLRLFIHSPLTTLSSTSTGFGTTVTPSSTVVQSTTGAASVTASSAASVPLKMNANVGAIAAIVFSAIAGAAIVAL